MFDSIKGALSNKDSAPDNGHDERFMPNFTKEYNAKLLVEKLSNVSELSDDEIMKIIYRQLDMLLDYDLFLANAESREAAQQLFTNERFLLSLITVIPNVRLTSSQITCCNKLSFDYCKLYGVDNRIGELLLQLSYTVNNRMVMSLSGIIGVEYSKILAMVRNSSFKETKNVSRVNNFIIKNISGLSVQNVLDMYLRMFDRVSTLFITTMNEKLPTNSTEEEKKTYTVISMTMLTMLDNMTSDEMYILLSNYGSDYALNRNHGYVRFSLNGLAESYSRISNVVEHVRQNGVMIP